ncbi:hypothetical protein PR048_019988 [Dryococelus australis]|uniref:Uncharacterized protein n=1 Tax=Dryococelus australis TaxID=614101 RepID=A0ABQ9H515_9NEOP|nr:hypothetical protein PR048_019988 [Dryococelus australis]
MERNPSELTSTEDSKPVTLAKESLFLIMWEVQPESKPEIPQDFYPLILPLWYLGATVAERLVCSSPTKEDRVQSPDMSLRIFASGNCAGRCLWSAGFSVISRFPHPFIHFPESSFLTSPSSALKISLLSVVQISSQDSTLHFTSNWASRCTPAEICLPARGKGRKPSIRLASNRKTNDEKWNRRSGGAVASALTSHQGNPGSIPGGFDPGFSHVGILLDDVACRWVFSGYSRFPAISFQRRSILGSHFMPCSGMTVWSSKGNERSGKREIPEETRRPVA